MYQCYSCQPYCSYYRYVVYPPRLLVVDVIFVDVGFVAVILVIAVRGETQIENTGIEIRDSI